MWRWAVGVLAAVSALAIGAGSAVAGDPPTVEEFPASFVLTSDTCSNLAPGTRLEGTGTGVSITRTRTDAHGVTTVSNVTRIHGTAVDQAGNSYAFSYANAFRVSNTGPEDPIFSGLMVDDFTLAGHGPAHLENGFVAVFTTDFESLFSFRELHSRGDPIDFATGASRCDPL